MFYRGIQGELSYDSEENISIYCYHEFFFLSLAVGFVLVKSQS